MQVGNGLGFGMEAFDFRWGSEDACSDPLQRDWPVEADLARLVHDAHTAAGEQLLQFVVAEAGKGWLSGS